MGDTGLEVRETEWEDSFYCPICGFRTDDLDTFSAEQEEVEGTEEVSGQGMQVITGGCGEVEVEEPDAPEERVHEAPPEEPKATAVSHKGWVTLDDFLTGQGGDARAVIETADGAEAPSAEGEEQEQEGSDQPYAAPEAGREPQSSGEQAAEFHQLFTRRESEDMRAIRRTLEWWAKEHWFTIVDLWETMSSITKAVVTVRTDRMPLYLFMLEQLHLQLTEIGFSVLFIKPIGENLAEIHIGTVKAK